MFPIGKSDNVTTPQKIITVTPQSKIEKQNSVFTEYDTLNGEIEPTMQSLETGDCWLLAGVNSLNTTSWGKLIIKDALRPDGEGGAYVMLKGAQGEQKEFHVSIGDLDRALESDKYSVGDDDMLAIELAVEKYAKKLVASGMLDKDINNVLNGGIDRNMIYLLSGVQTHNFVRKDENMDKALALIQQNPGKYAVICAFQNDTENLECHHAYTLKEIKIDFNGNKVAVLINPQNSMQTKNVAYEEFRSNLRMMNVLDDPANPDPAMKSQLDLINEELARLKSGEES